MNELRTLPEGLGEMVARHLVAAEAALMEEDEALAIAHVEAALRRAGRVAVVREAAGIAYYQAGQYSKALAEFRAVKRMTGAPAVSPLIADCERGLGRPQKALDYIRTIDLKRSEATIRVELLIVAAGARADMGNIDAAIVTLQIPELTRLNPGTPRARLQYAYAELLLRGGRRDEGREWMERAAASDIDEETDAAARCAELEQEN